MIDLRGYEAIQTGVAYYLQVNAGYLRIGGDDRIAFFQRQTTNDLRHVQPGSSRVTVLTSPIARILDVLRLVDEGDALGAITLPGYRETTARYLKSRIFFNDKVSLSDASEETIQIDIEGPQAMGVLQDLGVEQLPALDEVTLGNLDSTRIRVIGQRGLSGIGYRLLAEAGSLPDIERLLDAHAAERLSEGIYDISRIEAGLPSAGAELTGDYTPLETGLEWAVAENKGCYTGQEILARQMTYDKVTQHLAGLLLSSQANEGERAWVEGKPAGTITSSGLSPRFGPIALAILKRPFHQAGTNLLVGKDSGATSPAQVVPLPFQS
jgi:folate-binding protein YgfZ